MHSILVIDDNNSMRESLLHLFKREGYDVDGAESGQEGIDKFAESYFDLIITDLQMDNVDGLEVIKKAKEVTPSSEIVLITAFGTVESAVQAIKLGAYDYVTKQSDIEEILMVVERALERKILVNRITAINKELQAKYKFDEIIGSSQQMNDVLKIVTKVSPTDSTVLVTGASGTGKELIGRAIHYNSDRSDKPIVVLNCGAIPENLHESELFGHARGSFTGASSDKPGLIEEANRGTIVLDEIGELSTSAQVKLLRFIQNKEIRRVGETKNRLVDVRIIALTNRDLKAAIKDNDFREDLFFRLNVIPIFIPPLCERISDVADLIDHFLVIFKEKMRKPKLTISRRSIKLLQTYSWPGNVRELENVIERCVILCDGDEIRPSDLPKEISMTEIEERNDFVDTNKTLEEVEKRHIMSTWEDSKGNKTRAADRLGISRGTLLNKLRQYEIA